jgi:hypothetical protein
VTLPVFLSVMLMLYELEVLQSESERIGEPVALPLTDIINGGGNTARLGKSKIISRQYLQIDECRSRSQSNIRPRACARYERYLTK